MAKHMWDNMLVWQNMRASNAYTYKKCGEENEWKERGWERKGWKERKNE